MPTTKTKSRRNHPSRNRLPKGPNGGVQLLLIQSVEDLGKSGDVIEVKPGYANNYLLPQGLATIASDHHKRMVDKHREKLDAINMAKIAKTKAFAAEIGKQSITIEANANDDGHLYGSVGAAEIAKALKGNNISLLAEQIKLTGPLKELGLYTVNFNLGSDINGELKVWVVPSASEEAAS